MLFVGKAVENHTNEVRSMLWVQIIVSTGLLVMFVAASITQCVVMYLMWRLEEQRYSDLHTLTVNQQVLVQQRNGLFEEALERVKKNELRGVSPGESRP